MGSVIEDAGSLWYEYQYSQSDLHNLVSMELLEDMRLYYCR